MRIVGTPFFRTTAVTVPASAMVDPTDRSNWPAMRSSVAGQAMIPTTATFCRMLMRFSLLRKNGEAIEKSQFSTALETLWAFVRELNGFVDKSAPWTLAKTGKTDDAAANAFLGRKYRDGWKV